MLIDSGGPGGAKGAVGCGCGSGPCGQVCGGRGEDAHNSKVSKFGVWLGRATGVIP